MESTYNSTHVETNGRNKRKLLLQDLLETRLNMNMTSERFRSSVDLENFNLKCLLLCIIVWIVVFSQPYLFSRLKVPPREPEKNVRRGPQKSDHPATSEILKSQGARNAKCHRYDRYASIVTRN